MSSPGINQDSKRWVGLFAVIQVAIAYFAASVAEASMLKDYYDKVFIKKENKAPSIHTFTQIYGIFLVLSAVVILALGGSLGLSESDKVSFMVTSLASLAITYIIGNIIQDNVHFQYHSNGKPAISAMRSISFNTFVIITASNVISKFI